MVFNITHKKRDAPDANAPTGTNPLGRLTFNWLVVFIPQTMVAVLTIVTIIVKTWRMSLVPQQEACGLVTGVG